MRNLYITKLKALDRYFTHLGNFGYMDDSKLYQLATALLLIDSLNYFKDFITDEYTDNVSKVLKELDCCNCLIDFN